ncbi:MAG TPA: DoxX family protein [Candidatus Nanoarchaeia archaeon]|nr:DoxX family protein [Candidatus Nanoarchaeia archaeon]
MKDWSLLALRVVMAAIFIWHGIPKVMSLGSITSDFVGIFPGWVGPIVGILEILAGIALLIGFWHKRATMILGCIIIVAIIAVQLPGALERGVSAGIERDILILTGLWVVMTHGAGKYAIHEEE